MSSFYYCHDCKKAVDLKNKYEGIFEKMKFLLEQVCKECGGDYWEVRNGN